MTAALVGLPAQVAASPADGLEDPAIATAAPQVPRRPGEVAGPGLSGLPRVRRVRSATASFGTVGHGGTGGALAGKTVYVSAGHGWTYNTDLGWRTQRPNTHGLVEDFISNETIGHYLVRYLQNMGAHVVTVREADYNANLSVVDDADDGVDEGFAIEGELILADAALGYGRLAAPITDDSNPFTAGGARVTDAQSSETGRAVWTFTVPEDGSYNVYIGYVQDGSRASDAHYLVRHAGGTTHFRVDQRRHGSTWVWLGRFYFEAGFSPTRGAVALANDSADAGATLSADVARIGGGVGIIDRGGGANGRPMFENNSRYYAQLAGAPASVYDYASADGSDDVGTRSRFSAWDHEEGEDAVYISWHTNAPDPARGTSSFAYGPSSYGPLSEFSGVPGSLELMDAVHSEMIGDFRAVWEVDWNDRGQHTAYFGEVNPNHNPEMPAALFEIAFHDTLADADCLRNPQFRALAARAIAQGVANYFAARDDVDITLPPEPPAALQLVQDGADQLRLSWRAPVIDAAGGDPATAYRVYLSRDGLAFDSGSEALGAEQIIAAPADGAAIYARVTAVNDGGESFASPVVGARASPSGQPQVLVVAGFDRLDGHMLIEEDLADYALGMVQRGFIERINDGSHSARHGAAIAAAAVSFATVVAAAVDLGDVDLSDYVAVSWLLGEESIADDPLAIGERAAISAYVAGGGRLLISGSELAWVLDSLGDEADQAFFHEVLHAVYVADDAETYGFVGGEGLFAGLGELDFADFGAGSYDANFPDVIAPGPDAMTVLSYAGASSGGAATLWSDADGARVLVMGFPFETIAGAENRAEVMARILAEFEIEADPEPELPVVPLPPEFSGGCGCRSGGRVPGGGGVALVLALLAVVARRRW